MSQSTLKTKIVEFFCDADIAFEVVERKSFLKLLGHCNQKAEGMVVKTDALKDHTIKIFLENLNYVVMEALDDLKDQKIKKLHFTTDGWSTKQFRHAFLSLTGHWLNKDFQLKSEVFGLEEIKGMFNATMFICCIQEDPLIKFPSAFQFFRKAWRRTIGGILFCID